jgi:hypothetical protein
MTMIADTLYNMLVQKLRGFNNCDAPKIFRHFARRQGKYNWEKRKTNRHVSTQGPQSNIAGCAMA